MDTMLSEVEKGHFLSKEHIIVDLIKALEKQWVRDYTWVEIKIDISHSVIFKLPEDALKVIFDNLILNSIQNNDDKNHLFIYIKAKLNSDFLEIDYSDDGKGLNKKYITRPDKILEVHETSRSDGHGLGMWIVNNTIIMSGGVINKIEGKDGFRVNFSIGRMFR